MVFFTMADLVDQLQRDLKEDRLDRRLQALCKPKLLILDEMGYIRPKQPNRRQLRVKHRKEDEARLIIRTMSSGQVKARSLVEQMIWGIFRRHSWGVFRLIPQFGEAVGNLEKSAPRDSAFLRRGGKGCQQLPCFPYPRAWK